MSAVEATRSPARVRVWDWTVRTFHWSFLVLFGLMWWTGEEGHMDWHTRIGLVALGMLLFRLYWGFAGPRTARFSKLVTAPLRLGSYLKTGLRRPYRRGFGHNPLGALSVIALLSAMAATVGSGLFTVDVNGFAEGPLAKYLDFSTARDVADLHDQAFKVLQALVVLHVLAIAAYAIALRANLIGPMLTGTRATGAGETLPDTPITAPLCRVALGIGFAIGTVLLMVYT